MPRAISLLMAVTILMAVSHAKSSRHFDGEIDRVFAAMNKAVDAEACPIASSQENHSISFDYGRDWGSMNATADAGAPGVTVMIDVKGRHGATGELSLFIAITSALAGNPLTEDAKLRGKCEKERAKRAKAEARAQAQQLSGPVSPASVTIHGTAESVKSALVAECSARGFAIASESDHQLTVTRLVAVDRDASWLASKILVGNYTAEAYRANVQFTLAADTGSIVVSTVSEVLVQNGYGGLISANTSNDAQAVYALQQLLASVKNRVEDAAPAPANVQKPN